VPTLILLFVMMHFAHCPLADGLGNGQFFMCTSNSLLYVFLRCL